MNVCVLLPQAYYLRQTLVNWRYWDRYRPEERAVWRMRKSDSSDGRGLVLCNMAKRAEWKQTLRVVNNSESLSSMVKIMNQAINTQSCMDSDCSRATVQLRGYCFILNPVSRLASTARTRR